MIVPIKKGMAMLKKAPRNLPQITAFRETLFANINRSVPCSCSPDIASNVNRMPMKLNTIAVTNAQSIFIKSGRMLHLFDLGGEMNMRSGLACG